MDLLENLKLSLISAGWYLTEDGLKKLPDDVDKTDSRKIIKAIVDIDFREIAGGALPSEISRKDETIPGRVVLQIAKIRNISAPKANEDSKVAPRFLQLELTDGISQIFALEFEHIPSLSLNIPPGTKIFLKLEKVPLMQGMIVLRANDVQVLGGKVAALFEKWEISRTLLKYARGGRINTGTSGPPPWIPFGQKIQQNFGNDKNFKSLGQGKDKEAKENNEFDAMRQEAIAEAAKVAAKKVFGGGNQQILDHNVKKIIERGFTEEQAKNALRATRNNLERALFNLKRREEFKTRDEVNDKSSRSGGGGVGPKGRGPKDTKKSKNEEMLGSAKPAGNVSLFDYFTDKLPANSEVNEKPQPTKPERITKSYNETKIQQPSHHQQRQSSVPPITQQSSEQSQNNIPNNQQSSQNNRPKFENNISSSFANRNAVSSSDGSDGNYRNRNRNDRNTRGGGNSYNSYPRQYDTNDRYRGDNRDNNRNNPNRSQKPHERPSERNDRNSNYHNSTSQHVTSYDNRNRIDNSRAGSYDKGNKPMSSSQPRYGQKDLSNNYQSNKNYNDNRSGGHPQTYSNNNNNNNEKINKLAEETAKMKIDNNKSRTPVPNPQHQQQHQQHQPQPQQIQQQQQPHQQQQPQRPQSNPGNHSQQQHNVSSNSYVQLPNGFAYDPSKIMGFQNKETNEFAMNMLKNQNMNSGMPQPGGVHAQYPPPSMQIPTQQSYPPTQFMMMQPQHGTSFGISDGWNWKIGDRCLAKYWDDGRYYEAEITGLSDKTCVVWFIGYGNHEEVLKSDCLPITDAQHRPINFSKMNEGAAGGHNQHSQVNRGAPNRYRGERQVYVPPPKRES